MDDECKANLKKVFTEMNYITHGKSEKQIKVGESLGSDVITARQGALMKGTMIAHPSPCVSTANSVWNSPARLQSRDDFAQRKV